MARHTSLNISSMAQLCSYSALFSVVTCNTPNKDLRAISGYHKTRPFVCLARKQVPSYSDTRQSANYQPSSWSYDFVQALKNDHIDQVLNFKANRLEEEVKSMINNENTEISTKLELIDEVQRLGLGYKFEDEIRRALTKCAFWLKNNEETEKNIHTTSLCFRLLRQQGYEVSQDVFKGFMDSPHACLSEDVKGMLSLHEASYYAFEGENLLDEAREFTTRHLSHLAVENLISNGLAEQVNRQLELPMHHKMQRLEARLNIEAYSERSNTNRVLLECAKLDFNVVQSTLQSDLKDASRWWKDMGLADKLSFTRDRLMECFFWTVGMVFEPQYSDLRKGLTKVTSLITVIDDIYDVYGTLDELEQFTDAVERWDINCAQNLPEYMRICFLALYNTVNELVYDTLKKHDEYILPYLTKAWSDMLKAFLQEKRWSQNRETPTFEEYLENGWVSVSGLVILTHTYFLMSQNITKLGLESLKNYHNLLRLPSVIFRLCNDLGTSTAELERGETANSILCIMRKTGVSEESARQHIKDLVEETWKKMNKDITSENCPFEKDFVETTINLARIAQCTYENGDAHGAPDSRSKNRVLSVLIDPIR